MLASTTRSECLQTRASCLAEILQTAELGWTKWDRPLTVATSKSSQLSHLKSTQSSLNFFRVLEVFFKVFNSNFHFIFCSGANHRHRETAVLWSLLVSASPASSGWLKCTPGLASNLIFSVRFLFAMLYKSMNC